MHLVLYGSSTYPKIATNPSISCCLLVVSQGTGDAPVKVFDRTPNLAGAQIISYRTSPDGKWCVLIGITQGLPER